MGQRVGKEEEEVRLSFRKFYSPLEQSRPFHGLVGSPGTLRKLNIGA